MKKIIQASFITLFQSLVLAQPNDLETPVSIINDGLDTQAQMGSVFTLDGTNSYDPNGTIVSYDWSQSPNGTQVEFNSENDSIVTFTVPEESPNDISDSSVTCIIYLTVIDNDGNTDMSQIIVTGLLNDGGQQLDLSDASNTPDKFKLNQNYPNPFNPVTTLGYDLPENGLVNITIYDMLGNVVNNLVNTNQSSGFKSVQWNATNNQGEPVSAGVYLYSIEAGKFRQTKKMILLK
tara:strand:+ start:948 stop:1652 length:705 start_codon:yes stop_codon:yes gene_type:complete